MSTKIRLSVGFSGKSTELLRKYFDCSDYIDDIYTGGAPIIGSGRIQYQSSLNTLSEYVNVAHKNKATLSITLNSPVGIKERNDNDWWEKIKAYLLSLEDIGVDKIIASHPFLISTVKMHTKMKVVASTISEISNARSAKYYEDFGADIIVPSTNINFDIEELKRIRSVLKEAEIKLLANEVCLGNCPWRKFHHNYISSTRQAGTDSDYAMMCSQKYITHPHLFLTNNAIRPEDLGKYNGITNYFKLTGRSVSEDVILKMIRIYSNGYYDGNYLDFLDERFASKFYIPNELLSDLHFHKNMCKKNCEDCGYCKNLYDNIIK